MPIASIATTDELSSPYFLSNEEDCKVFESFFVELGGEAVGSYNAWSYNILGRIPHPNKWEFRIKKSTYSSGNIWLNSCYQSLQYENNWVAKNIVSDCSGFKIIRAKGIKRRLLTSLGRWHKLPNHPKYILKTRNTKHPFIGEVQTLLALPLELNNVGEIEYKNNQLMINMTIANTYYEIIKTVLGKTF